MRLPSSDLAGCAWHHGRSVHYRVHWVWEDAHRDERARSGGGFEGALPA
jgi:hypothetical protein